MFNGANVGENMAISANGSRVSLFRDVGVITMDLNDVEHVQVSALGGSDFITVGDLSGTDVQTVDIDLGVAGAGDSQADTVAVTARADTIVAKTVGAETIVRPGGRGIDRH